MADPLAWHLGARVPANDYRVFNTAFVDGAHPRTGAPKRFSLIEAVDWVNVIALTPASEGARVVMIKQFRVGSNSICLEIPGGMVDAGESPDVAAARELAEETGYTSTRWERLGNVSPNPAIMTNRLYSYLARDCVQTQPQRLEGSEVIDVELATLADCHRAIREGRIDHALVIVAFAHLALRE